MTPPSLILAAVLSTALSLLAGCGERVPDPAEHIAANAASAEALATPVTDEWLGQWTGPEGTFLKLAGGQGVYEVTIQNLDGPSTYTGKAVGDHVEFERQGAKESIRASNGQATGMKWLADKKNCLTIKAGEGYCKD